MNYYYIYVLPRTGVTRIHVEEKMNQGLDWFRFADGHYVVYSNSAVEKWYARLSPLTKGTKDTGRLFIVKLDPKVGKDYAVSNGWMEQEFWDWINKDRENA